LVAVALCLGILPARGQERPPEASPPVSETADSGPVPFTPPPTEPGLPALPINLPTALQLARVRALDIAVASEGWGVAAAVLAQASVLWLPAVSFGGDYFRHDGKIQDVEGRVFDTSKSTWMLGAGSGLGSSAVVSINDALLAPLAARQVVRAR